MRASMLEVMRQDFIRTARAKGLDSSRVIFKHALRNALIPIVTLLGLTIPTLLVGGGDHGDRVQLAGPGVPRRQLGHRTRDYPIVLATVMIGGTLVIIGNLLADIAYAFVDPRIRY